MLGATSLWAIAARCTGSPTADGIYTRDGRIDSTLHCTARLTVEAKFPTPANVACMQDR